MLQIHYRHVTALCLSGFRLRSDHIITKVGVITDIICNFAKKENKLQGRWADCMDIYIKVRIYIGMSIHPFNQNE